MTPIFIYLQGLVENFDDIVFACGSSGTAEGLSIGNYLSGSKLKSVSHPPTQNLIAVLFKNINKVKYPMLVSYSETKYSKILLYHILVMANILDLLEVVIK